MAEGVAAEMGPREPALEKIVNLFWERGAEVASYTEIVEISGLSRKSLYVLWPDKDALINDTLDFYHLLLLDYIGELMAPGGRKGLEAFWNGLDESSKRDGWRGCYLYRTASGPLRENPHVAKTYKQYFSEFSGEVERLVLRAQGDGDVDKSIDARAAGLASFALIGAISTIGGQSGYDQRVCDLINAARSVCGVR